MQCILAILVSARTSHPNSDATAHLPSRAGSAHRGALAGLIGGAVLAAACSNIPGRLETQYLVERGRLPASWYAGGPACVGRPAFRIHDYANGFFILRQPACTNFEKPFLYLIIGSQRALLLDTGAGGIDVAGPIDSLLGDWRTRHGGTPRELIVAHSHGHGDHVAGDSQFVGRAGVTVVGRDTTSVRAYFGLRRWPDDSATLDLGRRVVDVLPIPGHQAASLAFFDRRTGTVLTGDTFYPGRLYVRDSAAFVRSIDRLVRFTASRPVHFLLGTHIENTDRPYVDYPEGTIDQPAEHALEMTRVDLLSLDSVLTTMRGRLARTRLPAFTVWPIQ